MIEVRPQPGEAIRLRANLSDQDRLPRRRRLLGDETVGAPFETGWRKDVTVC